DSTVSNSSTHGIAVVNPVGSGQKNVLSLDRVSVENNTGDGVVANGFNTIVNLSNVNITGNNHGVNVANGGVINTYKNNEIVNNTNDNTAVMTTATPN